MTAKTAFIALSCVGAFASPAFAEEAAEADELARTIIVTGEQQRPEVIDSKAVAPLLDTPQTVTVISDQVLRKQNLLTLRDALQTIPGITFGAGEGGGGYGDSINLRGYSANNDITIDGVRDSAQYSRTDPFNLQQIEIYSGANSVYNGSGSVGGTINLVSKEPQPGDLTILQGSVGTDDYYRAAVDSNWRVSPLIAVRLNAVFHGNDFPGRDVERFKRWGVAPSLTIGVDSPTSLTLAYVHQRDDNTPIYGVPYFKSAISDGPLDEVDDSDYFGYRNVDTQETTVDRLTATFRHEFSEGLSVRNLTRWQRVGQLTQASQPQGAFCLSTGSQPIGSIASPTVGISCPANVPPGTFLPSGRGVYRDQVNQLSHNQTDLRWVSGEAGAVRNTLVVGFSGTVEDYAIDSGSLLRNPDGSAVAAQPLISLSNPDTVYRGPLNLTITSRSKSDTKNVAVYLFDVLEIGSMFEVNGAVRYENNRGRFRNIPLTFVPPGTAALTALQQVPQVSDENLFSYRFGGVFKPTPDLSIYAAYGNAKTPSSATVRLGCGVPTAAGAADPCATAPEKARAYEVGVKADVFDKRLQLTAALFRNERSNFRVPSNDPALPAGLQVLDGRSRVDGIAIGASGYITPEWLIFANYTYLDSEVLQSVSDRCLTTPSVACLNTNPAGVPAGAAAGSITIADPQRGDKLIQTPTHSGSLFTTYRLPFGVEIGYGLTYQGSFALHQRTLLNRTQARSDDYLTHRAFLGYSFDNGLSAQLNITNFTNEHYFTGIRNNVGTALTGTPNNGVVTGGWATPGEDRAAVFSLFYSF